MKKLYTIYLTRKVLKNFPTMLIIIIVVVMLNAILFSSFSFSQTVNIPGSPQMEFSGIFKVILSLLGE